MASPSSSSPAVLPKKTAILCHQLLALLLAAAFVLEMVSLFRPPSFGAELDSAAILLATASTLAGLWRRLPMQNLLLAGLAVAFIGGGLSALGAKTGLPFGPFLYTSGSGPRLGKILPWFMPLAWVIILLNSRGVARLMLRPWRKTRTYGFRVIGTAAFLVLLFDAALEPYAVRVKHCWLWMQTALPFTWQGASLMCFLAWAAAAVLILFVITPVLVIKKPRSKSSPDYHPLCVWLGAVILFGTGCAVHGVWIAVLVDVVIGLGTAFFAIRGAMW